MIGEDALDSAGQVEHGCDRRGLLATLGVSPEEVAGFAFGGSCEPTKLACHLPRSFGDDDVPVVVDPAPVLVDDPLAPGGDVADASVSERHEPVGVPRVGRLVSVSERAADDDGDISVVGHGPRGFGGGAFRTVAFALADAIASVISASPSPTLSAAFVSHWTASPPSSSPPFTYPITRIAIRQSVSCRSPATPGPGCRARAMSSQALRSTATT